MIFYQADDGGTNGADLASTVVDAPESPADGGLPEAASPDDVAELEQGSQAYQKWLKQYQEMLGYFHGGNTAQRASGESQEFPNFQTISGIRKEAAKPGAISGRDYLQMTGRINAGIGTGDTPIRGARGAIVGYTSPGGSALTGGSLVGGGAQLTPESDWRKSFPSPTDQVPITPAGTPAESRFARNLPSAPMQSAYAY